MQLVSKIIFGILLLNVACEASNNGTSSDNLANYNIQSAVINALPAILHEVSGITKIDENNFGVIQDENGILFIIDDVQEIKQFAIDHNVNVATKTKKKGQVSEPDIKFMTSGICIHPVSKKLYLLSARDHMLFIFDMNGKIENITKLDPELFNKSEGIAFLNNGDMFITNEGQNKMPTLIRLNYLK